MPTVLCCAWLFQWDACLQWVNVSNPNNCTSRQVAYVHRSRMRLVGNTFRWFAISRKVITETHAKTSRNTNNSSFPHLDYWYFAGESGINPRPAWTLTAEHKSLTMLLLLPSLKQQYQHTRHIESQLFEAKFTHIRWVPFPQSDLRR